MRALSSLGSALLAVGAFTVLSRFASPLLALAVLVAIVFFVVAPAALQAASLRNSGWIWQARYSLVLFVAVLLVAAVAIVAAAERRRLTPLANRREARSFLGAWLALVAVAPGASFFSDLARYASPAGAAARSSASASRCSRRP